MNFSEANENTNFLGYYYGISGLLAKCRQGRAGWFFINGETNSIWTWDVISGMWIDTNRVTGEVQGFVTNPSTFVPAVNRGVKTSYLYVAPAGKTTFAKFINSNTPVTINVTENSLVILFWNGDYWETSITDIGISLEGISASVASHVDGAVDDIRGLLGYYKSATIGVSARITTDMLSVNILKGETIRLKAISTNTNMSLTVIGGPDRVVILPDAKTNTTYTYTATTDMEIISIYPSEDGSLSLEVIKDEAIAETVERNRKEISTINARLEYQLDKFFVSDKYDVSTANEYFRKDEMAVIDIPSGTKFGIRINVEEGLTPFDARFNILSKDLGSTAEEIVFKKDAVPGKTYNFNLTKTITSVGLYCNIKDNITSGGKCSLSVTIYREDEQSKELDVNLMILGDSISTNGYYAKYLKELMSATAYCNIAVSGAWWGDKEGTVYDGNPQFQGADNNINNVIGNQVQKILNSKELYNNPAPNIILLSAGTNDANISEADLEDAQIEKHFTAGGAYIAVTSPCDTSDSYAEHRKSIPGAIRYCVTKLKEQYPKAEIYLLTPIQGAEATRPYSQIKLKQQLIQKVAARIGIKAISVGEECGIDGAEETRLADGRYLVDGLHPNDNGSKVMARYIANALFSYNSDKEIDVVIGGLYKSSGLNSLKAGDLVIASGKVRGASLSTRPYTDLATMTDGEKSYIVGIVVDSVKRTFVRVMHNIGKPLTGGEGKPLYNYTLGGVGNNYLASTSSMHPAKFDIEDGRHMVSFIAQYTNSIADGGLYNAINGEMAARMEPAAQCFYSDLYYNHGAQNTSDTNYVGAIKEVERVAYHVTAYGGKTIWQIYKEVAGITSDAYRLISCTHSYYGDTQCPYNLFNIYMVELRHNPMMPYETLIYTTQNAYEYGGVNYYYMIFDILP